MNEIGYYNQNNKTFRIFLNFHKFKVIYADNEIYTKHLKFMLKVQCYEKKMFEHFVNAWNLDRTKFVKMDWKMWKMDWQNLILLFKGDWHEARQFLIIVEKYLNDNDIELILNRDMVNAILMMKELG